MSSRLLNTAMDTEQAGKALAGSVLPSMIIFLEGPLGAGKTTFVKGFLRGLGYQGVVKSPTFTLLETYEINSVTVVHADLYRLKDPRELISLGIRDYFTENVIVLIEWASCAKDFLPDPTVTCTLKMNKHNQGRLLEIQWH